MKKKKSNLLMKKKIGIVFILFFVLQSFNIGICHAQSANEPRLTVEFKETPFVDVLNYIKRHTKYETLYNNEEIKKIPAVTHHFKAVSLSEVLRQCLEGTEYTFRFFQSMIVIQKRQKTIEPVTLRGKVLDERGEVLPGATVVVRGTNIGGSSNNQGMFVFNLPKMDTIYLLVSFVGYETREVVMTDFNQEVVVRMKPDTKEVDEVVVTGYGNVRKTSFTGNFVTVKRDELLNVSKTNVIKALEVFDPSFRIKTNNQWGSDPNALPEMQIRGQSSIGVKDLDRNSLSKSALENNPNLPIFILDNFETTIQKVYDMDPNRIESVTILKDAAATALYGSRASNGVVVITTVAPQSGEVRVTYNMVGTVSMPNLHDYNLMNAKEKLEAEVASGMYDISDLPLWIGVMRLEEYQAKLENVIEGVDTYWLSKPLRSEFNHKHSLYLEGGNKEFRYGIDFSYNNENGVMKGSYRDRIDVGFSMLYTTPKVQVTNKITYGVTKEKESPYGDFSTYTKLLPYEKYRDEDGKMLRHLNWSQIMANERINPLYEAELGSYDKGKTNSLTDNLSVNWYIKPTLWVRAEASVSQSINKREKFVDPLSVYNNLQHGDDRSYVGSLTKSDRESISWEGKFTVSYNESILNHNINLSGGVEVRTSKNNSNSGTYKGFQSAEFSSPEFARDMPYKPSFSETQSRLFGVYFRLNYSYRDIYLADATIRFDGSSEFGSDKRYAPFLSAGVGLNIHKYPFMEQFGFINHLKVRGSFGQTGNVNFSPYAAVPSHVIDTDEWYVSGPATSLMLTRGNRNLKWEKTNKLDMGFELGVLRDLVYLEFSWYNEVTNGLINDASLPSSTGFTTYLTNVGKVENRGFELQLRTQLLRTSDWYVAVYANMAHNKNVIKEISDSQKAYNDAVNEYYNQEIRNFWDEDKPNLNRVMTKYEEGQSLSAKYGLKSLGIDPATGEELYVYRDGTVGYEWRATEMQNIGDELPWGTGAFGMNLRWKNFTLSTSFTYKFGGDFYNETLIQKVENAQIKTFNVDRRALTQRWQNFGDVVMYKDIKSESQTTNPTSRFMQRENILEWNSMTIGYEIGSDKLKKFGIDNVRFEVGTNDLWRLSTVKAERGLSYPYANSVNFSVNVRF
ncbi:SusC/RagA family TonB-linked outer membrane protein [Butyricimonas synergistica]|uniref:SusC/RagA family TonB-linked outer membrane protein n=1 Tax=Butyricimonas synergistica TaxID=544644 RepID=UPI000372BBFC|nr:SusC/RagA family TonB-linked outer membrane protein [Butyricimonas synergistica]